MKPYAGITKEMVIEATLAQVETTTTTMSEKAQSVAKIIEGGDFGCKTKAVADLIGVIIGEEIVLSATAKKPVTWSAVVFLSNDNGHNYDLNKVLIVAPGDEKLCFRPDGTTGNHAPLDSCDAWRYATAEEIDKAFNG